LAEQEDDVEEPIFRLDSSSQKASAKAVRDSVLNDR
jgi:hypothetical protein